MRLINHGWYSPTDHAHTPWGAAMIAGGKDRTQDAPGC
jgi:hypothetical protein